MNQNQWLERASLCELIAMGLRLPTFELGEAVSSGEFCEAAVEIATANEFDEKLISTATQKINTHKGTASEELFHVLRAEYTHLLVGFDSPIVSPYAGVWWAEDNGVEPMLFVNKRSMAVERYMRSFGIGQAEGKNEPLDHIATMFEFLQYCSLVNAEAVQPPEGIEISAATLDTYVVYFMVDWVDRFAEKLGSGARQPFYEGIALFVRAFIEKEDAAINLC